MYVFGLFTSIHRNWIYEHNTISNKTILFFLIWYYSQMRLWNGCSCQMNDVQNEAIKSHIIWNENTKYTRSHHIVSLFDNMTRLIWLWLHQNFLRLWVWKLVLPFVHTINIEFLYQHKNMLWNVLLTTNRIKICYIVQMFRMKINYTTNVNQFYLLPPIN